MRIDQILKSSAPTFSFEFFPPKTNEALADLFTTIGELRTLQPSFVSVTYGAGGSTRIRTLELVTQIKRDHGLEPMAHFTCVGASQTEIRQVLSQLQEASIDNILALRGDPPKDTGIFVKSQNGFSHATELIELLAKNYDFCIGAACYPEKHLESKSLDEDIQHAIDKVNLGADFLITQLFFDNQSYFDFIKRIRTLGIDAPVIPGLMPVTSLAQIERFTKMIGASLPAKLQRDLVNCGNDIEAVQQIGIEWTTRQCLELLKAGAPGIHFYTLNRSLSTRAILVRLRSEVKPIYPEAADQKLSAWD